MTNWPVKTLGSICKIYQPQTIGTKDLVPDGPYVVYGANGPIGRYSHFNHENSEVTVGCRGTCGKVNVTPPRVWITGNAMVVCPNEDEISKPMLRYFLEGLDYSSVITGTAQPQITRTTLAPVEIPIPPLEEQKRIVALLDDATARITELTACYEQARTHANNLFTSALREALEGNPDWPFKNLGEVCEILDSLRKPITKRDRVAGNYPYYGATGIVDVVADYIFDERLVLVGEDGAKWGAGEKTAFIAEGRYWVNNHAHVLRCKPDVLVDSWLTNFLNMSDLNRYVSGLTVPKLNQGSLVSIEIPVPPLGEQKRIVARLDQMRAKTSEMVAAYDAKLQAAKNLRQSILEAAFAGEL